MPRKRTDDKGARANNGLKGRQNILKQSASESVLVEPDTIENAVTGIGRESVLAYLRRDLA